MGVHRGRVRLYPRRRIIRWSQAAPARPVMMTAREMAPKTPGRPHRRPPSRATGTAMTAPCASAKAMAAEGTAVARAAHGANALDHCPPEVYA